MMPDIKEKKVVFVDFFDTIMFRKIHPFQIYKRWALLLSDWCNGNLTEKEILNARYQAITKITKDEIEQSWWIINNQIYETLKNKVDNECSKDDFISISHQLEINAEIGAQYPHMNLLSRLKILKEQGLRIYIVSDFHLDHNDLILFLKAKNISLSLFDGIFVSSECGCSKANGNLYKHVLNEIKISPRDVLMIGDNPISDGRKAEENGIMSKVEHNYGEKIKYQIRRLFGYDYAKYSFHSIEKTCRRFNSPYCEYALIFWFFNEKLRNILIKKGAHNVTFLSREGHYLKRSFDGLINPHHSYPLYSHYFLCSRRASQSTERDQIEALPTNRISLYDYLMACGYDEKDIHNIAVQYKLSNESLHDNASFLNENKEYLRLKLIDSFDKMIFTKLGENKENFIRYVDSFEKDDVMNIVDIGWRGGMQETIERQSGKKTDGYYVGLINSIYPIENKKGVVFSYCPEKGMITGYSDILRANTQLYEQLTAAPHGSAVGYVTDEKGEVKVLTDWAENEKKLYVSFIEKKQEEMLLIERGISAWAGGFNYAKGVRNCAKLVLRSALFADKERLDFLKHLDDGFIWNFNSQAKGLSYSRKEVRLSFDIVYAPERYTRYFAKIQRSLRSRLLLLIYKPIAYLIFGYTWSWARIKNN